MILLQIFANEIRAEGELVNRLAAVFEIRGQKLTLTKGDAHFIQRGMPVCSERYDRLIDFNTDGEEWARNLPTAYRNGAMYVHAEEVLEPAGSASRQRTAAVIDTDRPWRPLRFDRSVRKPCVSARGQGDGARRGRRGPR